MIILYITVTFPSHSSRGLLVNQKPTTLRKNVAKLNETSLRCFKLILDLERSNRIYSQFYRGIHLSIIEKYFQSNCSLSLSLFDRSPSIIRARYIRYITVILSSCFVAKGRELLYVFIRDLLLTYLDT